MGEPIGKNMIAVRIGPDWRFAVVGASAYFVHRAPPDQAIRPNEAIATEYALWILDAHTNPELESCMSLDGVARYVSPDGPADLARFFAICA